MRMASLLVVLGVVGVTIVVHGATRKVDFSDGTVGQPPKGFEFGHTAKAGAPGKWIVQAEGDNKVLAQVDADSTRARFPVAVVTTSVPPMSTSRFGSSRSRVALTRPPDWCGGFRTKTTTTSFARTRSRTTSCSTRSRMASARTFRSKAKAGPMARRATCRQANGARCGSSPMGVCSRCT